VHDQLVNGGPLKMPCVLDENTRYCLVIEAGRSLCSQDVFRFRSGTFEPHQKSRATRTYASAGGCRASSRMFRLLFFHSDELRTRCPDNTDHRSILS